MTALAALTLLRPLALVALAPLALLWWLLRRRAHAGAAPQAAIAPHLLAALTIGGPAWRAAPSPFVTETAPLVVALDLSASMSGTDVAPSRLERAKQKIRDLIELRTGGRVGLVAYAGTAHLVMPLTDDPTVLAPFLEALDPGVMPEAGRSASAALALAQGLLAREDAPGSVLFVTDGIDPGDAAAFPADGGALAALIVAPDGGGAEVADWSRRGGVATVAVSVDDGDVRALQRALASRLARAAAAEGRLQDDGWILALPAAALVLLAFRRGVAPRWGAALLALALVPLPGGARAEGLTDLLWTPDQQGRRLYDAHRYAEAADAFADPMWRAAALFRAGRYAEAAALYAPIQTAVAQYDRGVALARGRDYQGAKAAFEAALALDPANRPAQDNLAVTERIIAYLTETRDAEDQGAQSEPPDDTADDLTGDQGRPVRIDAGARLSEDAAAEWMRSVETRPADFLKRRFAVEAARPAP